MSHNIARFSETITVINVAAMFPTRMEPGQLYRLCGNVDAWFATGSIADVAGRAVPEGDGAVYLPAKTYFDLRAHDSTDGYVAVIKDADTPVEFFMNLALLESA